MKETHLHLAQQREAHAERQAAAVPPSRFQRAAPAASRFFKAAAFGAWLGFCTAVFLRVLA